MVAPDVSAKGTKEIPSRAIIIKTRGGKRSAVTRATATAAAAGEEGERKEEGKAAGAVVAGLRVRNCRDYGYVSSEHLGARMYDMHTRERRADSV